MFGGTNRSLIYSVGKLAGSLIRGFFMVIALGVVVASLFFAESAVYGSRY
jgi:hypothetical protein